MCTSQPPGKDFHNELLRFYDDFVEFQDHCAFLCSACASLAGEEEMDKSSVMGLKRYCYWLQERMEHLKQELKDIRETS